MESQEVAEVTIDIHFAPFWSEEAEAFSFRRTTIQGQLGLKMRVSHTQVPHLISETPELFEFISFDVEALELPDAAITTHMDL